MLSVKQLAKDLDGVVIGDEDFVIKGVCDIEKGKIDHITYLKNSSYEKFLNQTNASVVLIDEKNKIDNSEKIFIKVKNSGLAFIKILNEFKYKSSSNIIEDSNIIGNDVTIHNNVYLGNNLNIGDDTTIYPGSYIGDHTTIGKSCIIFPNVTIYDNTIIGNDCKIDSGTVIGSDGFGLLNDNNKNISIPHIGSVIIGDDVFIGANCCIDRGTINNTKIGDNCRLDNLVQIAHNVKIGNSCVIAGQTGIAGSSIIGNNVTIAGQSGIIDHLHIGDFSVIAAKSLVCNSLGDNSFVSGNPAINHKDRLRQIAKIKNIAK